MHKRSHSLSFCTQSQRSTSALGEGRVRICARGENSSPEWATSSVVERALSMREAAGSIPALSIPVLFLFFGENFLCLPDQAALVFVAPRVVHANYSVF